MLNRSAMVARRYRPFVALCALTLEIVGFSLTGCGGGGGGGGGTQNDPAGSKAQVTAGQTKLNSILSNKTDPDYNSLSDLLAIFADAYNKDKSNPQAKFGYATTDIALAAQKLIDIAGGLSRAARAQGKTDPITETAQQAIPWRTSRLGIQNNRKMLSLVWKMPGAVSGMTRAHRQVDPDKIRSVAQELLTRLNSDLPLMEDLAKDPSFNFDVVNYNTGTGTLHIDQADLQAILTGLYGVRAILAVALAYDFNPHGFDFNRSVAEVFPDKTDGSAVIRDEYLPAAPFGDLTGDGKGLFASAKSDLEKGADELVIATVTLASRSNTTGHLIDGSNITTSDLQSVKDGAATFKSALNNTVTLEDGTEVNAVAWFNNPPSLRALLPTYRVSHVSDYRTDGTKLLLTANNGDFPDATFGGLIVNPRGDLKVEVDQYGNLGDLASASTNYYGY